MSYSNSGPSTIPCPTVSPAVHPLPLSPSSLLPVFPHKQTLMLVFEHMEMDLEAVIKDASLPLPPADIKAYLQVCERLRSV